MGISLISLIHAKKNGSNRPRLRTSFLSLVSGNNLNINLISFSLQDIRRKKNVKILTEEKGVSVGSFDGNSSAGESSARRVLDASLTHLAGVAAAGAGRGRRCRRGCNRQCSPFFQTWIVLIARVHRSFIRTTRLSQHAFHISAAR